MVAGIDQASERAKQFSQSLSYVYFLPNCRCLLCVFRCIGRERLVAWRLHLLGRLPHEKYHSGQNEDLKECELSLGCNRVLSAAAWCR